METDIEELMQPITEVSEEEGVVDRTGQPTASNLQPARDRQLDNHLGGEL